MKVSLTDVLACPQCGGQLRIKAVWVVDEVNTGDLYCEKCGATYPIVRGIPRFVKSDSYVQSFSYEWQLHDKILVDSISHSTLSRDTFLTRTGLKPEDVKGKLVLDAGCGTGRFMEVVRNFGGTPIGIDLSYSVNDAQSILGADARLVQGDLMNLPFKPESFDIVFSIGVIHHTPSAKQAFLNLAKLVKPGGVLSVWVYSNEGWEFKLYNLVSNTYRVVTTRLPKDLLHKLSWLSVPTYGISKIPVIGMASCLLFPRSTNPVKEIRVLDTFDWYSPKYQSKHTFKEVQAWCSYAGFSSTRLHDAVSVKAVRQ